MKIRNSGVGVSRVGNVLVAVFALSFMMSCVQFDKNVMTASWVWNKPFDEVRRGVESVLLGNYSTLLVTEEDSLTEKGLRELRPELIVAIGSKSMFWLLDKTEVPIVLVTWVFPCAMPPNVAVAPIVVSPDKQMEIIAAVLPEVRHIGFMYSDVYAPLLAAELWDAARNRGLRATAVKVESEAEVLAEMEELAGKTDAMLIIPDLIAYPYKMRPEIYEISARRKYPVITCFDSPKEKGAVLAIIPSLFEVGVNTTELGKKIFEGKSPGELARIYANHPKILADHAVAKSMGVKVNRCEIAVLGNQPLMYDRRPTFRSFP